MKISKNRNTKHETDRLDRSLDHHEELRTESAHIATPVFPCRCGESFNFLKAITSSGRTAKSAVAWTLRETIIHAYIREQG